MSPPTLVFIVGPPAVGKMTVGYELARRRVYDERQEHMRIDNTHVSASDVAQRVIERFGLALIAGEGYVRPLTIRLRVPCVS